MPRRANTVSYLPILGCLLLVSVGLMLRFLPASSTTAIPEQQRELRLAQFLAQHHLQQIKRVHFTNDAGITGVQGWLPICDGFVHATVMPLGDEFLDLWQDRAARAGTSTAFWFRQRLYQQFPRLPFWLNSMHQALLNRLGQTLTRSDQPVIALSYPASCQQLFRIPWSQLSLQGAPL